MYEIRVKNAKKYIKFQLDEIFHTLGETSQDYLKKMVNDMLALNADDEFFNERMPHRASRTYSLSFNETSDSKRFLSTNVDLKSVYLKTDDSPFSIVHTTVFAKIQFMFLMLNLSQVYVTEKGVLIGIIVRDSFIKTALRHNYSLF
jgi:hypothetical protein